MLILDKSDVRKCLDPDALIGAVGDAMKAFSAGTAQQPLRQRLLSSNTGGMLASLPSYMESTETFCVKVVSGNSSLTDAAGFRRVAQVVVLASTRGEILSVMHGTDLGTWRTSACSAFAAGLLARPDARSHAIVGIGAQGRAEALFVGRHLGIRDLRVVDLNTDRASACAEDLGQTLGIPVRVCETVEEAVEGADVVSLTTNSRVPVIRLDWLAPGCHVSALGAHNPKAREVCSDTMAHSRVFCESRAALLAEAGDFIIPMEEGRFSADHLVGEIGAVGLGICAGRRAGDERTLFKSTGVGLQDLAAASLFHSRAVAAGIGRYIDL